jgi:hypothetical protein
MRSNHPSVANQKANAKSMANKMSTTGRPVGTISVSAGVSSESEGLEAGI